MQSRSARQACAAAAGRLISNGLLDQAVANARHNVERLHDWASRGGTIIACEPSCILTIKDDYPALLKGELAPRPRRSPRLA